MRLASFSSDASTSVTPRTFFDPSSTPMTTVPPAVFANATRVLRMPSGDDKSRLNSRVFPSWRFSSSTSFPTPHSTRKRTASQDFRPFRTLYWHTHDHSNLDAAACGRVRRKHCPVLLSADGSPTRFPDRRNHKGNSPVRNLYGPVRSDTSIHQPHGETGWECNAECRITPSKHGERHAGAGFMRVGSALSEGVEEGQQSIAGLESTEAFARGRDVL